MAVVDLPLPLQQLRFRCTKTKEIATKPSEPFHHYTSEVQRKFELGDVLKLSDSCTN